MSSPDDIMFMIDGVLGTVAMAKTYYEQEGATTMPVDSIGAALMTMRALVEAERELAAADDATGDPGACQHPAGAVVRTLVGGGNYLLTCTACNEIIEQSGQD